VVDLLSIGYGHAHWRLLYKGRLSLNQFTQLESKQLNNKQITSTEKKEERIPESDSFQKQKKK